MNISDFAERTANKKIAVLGLGISNFPLIEFLHKCGAGQIVGFDKSDTKEMTESLDELKKKVPFTYYLGSDYLNHLTDDFDEIYKTPVIRYDIPELERARKRGCLVTGEMEEFMKICPAKIYAVTGSDGKTTTTTILYNLLKENNKNKDINIWVGGNIGKPLLSFVDRIKENDKVVLELSSFQLMNMPISPDIALITNISPNHLDVHKSYEEYIEAKKSIFKHQNGCGMTILNKDNAVTKNMISEVKSNVRLFGWGSDGTEKHECVYCENGKIYAKTNRITEIMDIKDIRIPGMHNVENYMAAIAALINEVNIEDIDNVAKNFNGVEHRIEFVREINGVKYYNSSIDSSPNRTIHALSVFENSIVLIAGGKDKNIPYDDMGKAIYDKVRVLVLTGPTAEKIERSARDEYKSQNMPYNILTIHCKTYEEAVNAAYREARSGEVVLLSPASTSFDMFKNFEERGKVFKQLVNSI